MHLRNAAVALLLSGLALSCTEHGPRLVCRATVPPEFRHHPPNLDPPPNGQPESVRYTESYEAFWWNCVMLKAEDVDARCPFMCSGTPGATDGCMQGGTEAENGVSNLLRKYSVAEVQQYLKSIATKPEVSRKIEPYFQHGPEGEAIPE